jgi:HPt (histidine-containing phosphotransfer) domain-containing protein
MADFANRRRDDTVGASSSLRDMFKRATIERLNVIDSAVMAVRFGRLDETKRANARRAAHKIADAARMFGYWDAAQLALEIEAAFEGSAPIPSIVLSQLFEIVEQLRQELSVS